MEFQEHEDILGQPTLPIVPKDPTGTSYFTVTKSIFALITLFGLYVVGMRIRREVLIWREKAYKLENRRRHGIPDSDRRPFNVAYAAARRDREESINGQKPKRALSKPVQQQQPLADDTREPQGLTNRSNRLRSVTSVAVPGAFVPTYLATPAPPMPDQRVPSPSRSNFTDQSSHKRTISESRTSTRSWNRHEAETDNGPDDLTSEGDLTRDAVWDGDSSPHKMSDIDEDMEWVPSTNTHKRSAAKRPFNGEEADSEDDEGVREKRQRKVSLDHSVTMVDVGAGMEVDEDEYDDDDEVPDIVWPTIGSKRGRAEAASTFGDDSENEDDTKSTRRHRKKRQTGSRRQSTVGSVYDSKKRGREDDEPTPSEAGTLPRRSKKNRKALPEDMELWSVSSSGRRPRKREIGEEWESNGVRYKIGPNAQRLRQALVKKARSKFTMPRDSNHPDRNANLEVYVETWLSEAEYKEARENRLLAWQETSKYSANEPENLSLDISTARSTPSRSGKNLLWQSTNNTPLGSPIVPGSPLDSPSDITSIRPKGVRTPGRYSLGVAARANPFEKPATSVRRIVSTSLGNQSTPSKSLTDKTNSKEGGDSSYVRPRNLSKWEKQEVEAQAIARLRALKQAESEAAEKEKREKERVEKEKAEKVERERKEKEAAAAAAAGPPPKIPTITVTQPSTDSIKPPAPAGGGFSFGPTPAAKTNGTSSAAPPATTPAAAPSTNLFGPAKTTPALPTNLFGPPATTPAAPSAPTPAAQPEAPKAGNPLFNFKTPAPVSGPATPAATPSAAPPSLFGPSPGIKKENSFSGFGQPTSSTASTPAAAPAAPSTGFSFAKPPTTANPTPAASTAPSGFSFGPSKPADVPAASAGTPSSLAGALGSAPPLASAPSTGASGSNMFSFKPSAPTAASTPAATSGTQAGKSGFNFGTGGSTTGFGTTPASTPSVFAPAAPSAPSPFGSKPATSAFGTTAPASSTSAPTAIAPTASTSSPFSFSTTPAASTTQDKGKDSAKPNAFAGFGSAGSGPSAFGSTSTASPFGATANGTSGNIFGSKPAATTNGSSSNDSTSKFSFSGVGTVPKASSFTFGTPSAPVATSPAASTPSTTTPFSFAKPSATTGAPSTNGGSVFGATSAPKSVFGAPSSTTPATGNLFNGAGAKPLSAFGFPAPPASNGTTPAATGGAGASTTPSFNFGAK